MIVAPLAYQGSKQRIAGSVVDAIAPTGVFYDVCCGSGSVTIELLNRGWDPARIVMVDAGPWGLVWQAIGAGTFDADRFACACAAVPDAGSMHDYLLDLSRRPTTTDDVIYTFLLLQAGSFGGRAVGLAGSRWLAQGFRHLWQPKPTSVRRSRNLPMTPAPSVLAERMRQIADRARGVQAVRADAMATPWRAGAGTAYLDPPYSDTKGYADGLDVAAFVRSCPVNLWISEQRPLGLRSHRIARLLGREEWLTNVRPAAGAQMEIAA